MSTTPMSITLMSIRDTPLQNQVTQ
jgi:hypothetical protein